MKIRPVILCGGAGTRLWPNQKNHQAKQFIDFGGWTLIQKALERVKNLIFDYPIISTNSKYLKQVKLALKKSKVKKYKIVLEPAKKNTAPAIISSALIKDIPSNQALMFFAADHLIEKYLSKISNENDKKDFENYLKTINRQIKDIEHLVNEFSDFARMPKPILKNIDIKKVVARTVDLHSLSNSSINFSFLCEKEKILIAADEEQLNRVFINLIKNSIESIMDKSKKNGEFAYKIDIEIKEINNYIYCTIDDNGIGFSNENLDKIVKPYFTTKVKGTGLGLAIVNKIINDHDGKINFKPRHDGARVEIILPKNVS